MNTVLCTMSRHQLKYLLIIGKTSQGWGVMQRIAWDQSLDNNIHVEAMVNVCYLSPERLVYCLANNEVNCRISERPCLKN